MVKQREKNKPIMRKVGFSLIGIFIGGILLRIALFFFGVNIPHGIYSHLINYPIVIALISYTILQIIYKITKHKFL